MSWHFFVVAVYSLQSDWTTVYVMPVCEESHNRTRSKTMGTTFNHICFHIHIEMTGQFRFFFVSFRVKKKPNSVSMLCVELENSIVSAYVIQSNSSNTNIIYLEQKQMTIDQRAWKYETVQHPNFLFPAYERKNETRSQEYLCARVQDTIVIGFILRWFC